MTWFRGDPVAKGYEPHPMRGSQMRALEQFIARSPDATDFAKKVYIWTLRQTELLTLPVALSLWGKDYSSERTAEVQDGVHAMVSCNGHTHLDTFFEGMGTKVHLMHHCGCFTAQPEKGKETHDTEAKGTTIWVSYVWYDYDIKLLTPPPLDVIEAIQLDDGWPRAVSA